MTLWRGFDRVKNRGLILPPRTLEPLSQINIDVVFVLINKDQVRFLIKPNEKTIRPSNSLASQSCHLAQPWSVGGLTQRKWSLTFEIWWDNEKIIAAGLPNENNLLVTRRMTIIWAETV